VPDTAQSVGVDAPAANLLRVQDNLFASNRCWSRTARDDGWGRLSTRCESVPVGPRG
jgi:hypothetical protein